MVPVSVIIRGRDAAACPAFAHASVSIIGHDAR
jgi:hypothetical protein